MIRFVCECGKQLQVRDEHAGKRVACPACQRQVTVPDEPLPVEAVQANRPLRRDEEDLEEEEEIEDHSWRGQPSGTSRKAVVSLVLGILSLFCNLLASVPAVILAILAFRDISSSRGRLSGQGLAIAGIVTACVCTLLSCGVVVPIASMSLGLFLPAFQKVREAASRVESQNNLKQIALGLLTYQSANNGRFPAAAICDKNGKPLLSWRVAILPYIQQEGLYKQFKLDEPWDSPNNSKLLGQMPHCYKPPDEQSASFDYTRYLVFVGKSAAFDKTQGHSIGDFTDGLSNTILIVEAPSRPVRWTMPEDIDFDPNIPIKRQIGTGVVDLGITGFSVAMADGSVRWVKPQISENTLKAAITRNGRDALGPDW